MHALSQFSLTIFNSVGYVGLAAALCLNAMGIPLSSEVLLPTVGLVTRSGNAELIWILVAAIGGQMAGATFSYLIGNRGGVPFLKRYGKYVLINERELGWAHQWFNRYGKIATPIGYCLPLIRGYVGYAAGISEMSLPKFLISAFVGITIWTLALTGVGYYAGGDIATVERILQPLSIIVVIAVVAGIIVFMTRKRRAKRQSK